MLDVLGKSLTPHERCKAYIYVSIDAGDRNLLPPLLTSREFEFEWTEKEDNEREKSLTLDQQVKSGFPRK